MRIFCTSFVLFLAGIGSASAGSILCEEVLDSPEFPAFVLQLKGQEAQLEVLRRDLEQLKSLRDEGPAASETASISEKKEQANQRYQAVQSAVSAAEIELRNLKDQRTFLGRFLPVLNRNSLLVRDIQERQKLIIQLRNDLAVTTAKIQVLEDASETFISHWTANKGLEIRAKEAEIRRLKKVLSEQAQISLAKLEDPVVLRFLQIMQAMQEFLGGIEIPSKVLLEAERKIRSDNQSDLSFGIFIPVGHELGENGIMYLGSVLKQFRNAQDKFLALLKDPKAVLLPGSVPNLLAMFLYTFPSIHQTVPNRLTEEGLSDFRRNFVVLHKIVLEAHSSIQNELFNYVCEVRRFCSTERQP